MKKYQFFIALCFSLSLNLSHAEEYPSYQRGVLEKLGNGFANLTTGVLELPKNIINVSNENNVFFGVAGGLVKGSVNMLGRMGVGVLDVITAPIPTQPVVYPQLIWDDFDVDTQYGKALRLPKEYQQ